MVNNIAIKICGINDSETARACINVDYVGLVFYQKSPRFVTAFQAKEISKFFSKNTKKVGLFVNANIEIKDAPNPKAINAFINSLLSTLNEIKNQ